MANNNCTEPTPICDQAVGLCVPAMSGDAGVDAGDDSGDAAATDSGVLTDASMMGDATTMDANLRGDAARDGAVPDASRGDGAMDGGAINTGLISGDGACACRVPGAPTRGSNERGVTAMAALSVVAMVFAKRRARTSKPR